MDVEERENSEVISLNAFGHSSGLDLPDLIKDFVRSGPHKTAKPTRRKKREHKDRTPISKGKHMYVVLPVVLLTMMITLLWVVV